MGDKTVIGKVMEAREEMEALRGRRDGQGKEGKLIA